MRLIDILNKIANGELKEGIKIRGGKFEFTCDTYFWANQVDFYKDLNTEVELIEPQEPTDNTKIEELIADEINGKSLAEALSIIGGKVNEVIRYINKGE